jgi:hypothetical protein
MQHDKHGLTISMLSMLKLLDISSIGILETIWLAIHRLLSNPILGVLVSLTRVSACAMNSRKKVLALS